MNAFVETCRRFPASFIARRIGCSRTAAHNWQTGNRLPLPWVQRLVVEKLGDPAEAPERDNRGRKSRVYP